MSDILFRFLLMAQRREGGRLRHLLFARRGLLTAGVEQLVESAITRVVVRSQHEVITHRHTEAPASHRHRHTFVGVATPNRPRPHHFATHTEVFPLRASLNTETCPPCLGTGTNPCGRCNGSGRRRCRSCRGAGFSGKGARRKICRGCGGTGRRDCRRCDGRGRLPCTRCDAEGRLATWTEAVYTYTVLTRSRDGYPIDDPPWRLRRASTRGLDRARAVHRFAPSEVESHLGYLTAASRQMADAARTVVTELEGEARGARGRCLFVETQRFIEPLGYSVLRLRGRPEWYWLVGRGSDAVEVAPFQLPSPLRLLVWLALLACLGLTGLFAPLVFSLGMSVPTPALMGFLTAGLLSASLVGALVRLSDDPSPVRTVAVMRPGPGPGPFLPVLASVGSHVGALTVTDRNHVVFMEALRGLHRSERQSLSLSVRTCDGLGVRFVELARPNLLTEAQCTAIMKTVDAVLLLDDGQDALAGVRARLDQVPRPRARQGTVTLQKGMQWADGAVPLEWMQRAFVAGEWDDARWQIAFRDVWAVIAPAFQAHAVHPAPPPPLTGPVSPPALAPTAPLIRENLSSMRRIVDFLFPRRQQVCKVPILGVEGCGKSSLIVTLGQYVSLHEHGRIPEASQPVFGAYLPYVMQGRPLRATARHSAFSVELSRVPETDGTHSDVDLLFTSEDIPGQDFRMLVNELTRNPELAPSDDGAGAIVKRFSQLLSDCDGFIFVVDLMRSCTPAQFRADPRTHIWNAYGDQVKPIMTGILLAAQHNATLAHKPMFFVFSKPDLHGLSVERLEEDFRRAMAIPLGGLRARDVRTRLYSVQCAGWGMDSNLDHLGIDRLLSDLAHSVGAVRSKD